MRTGRRPLGQRGRCESAAGLQTPAPSNRRGQSEGIRAAARTCHQRLRVDARARAVTIIRDEWQTGRHCGATPDAGSGDVTSPRAPEPCDPGARTT